ncbi:MAG TPA: 3-isopropylmalate dehydrogenase [Dehalococcoidia bacterium]|nr:3-isopropylmalate dehydrogenase [Dehalococcoidia bacterium]
MATYKIGLLPGDGIGPDVIAEAVKVLDVVERKFGHQFEYSEDIVGGAAIDRYRNALRPSTLAMCKKQDAILFGAVGGPKWDDPRAKVRPEQAILGLRKGLGLFANIRPVKMYPFLANSTALKRDVVKDVDMVVLRELTGGIYFGKPQKRWKDKQGRKAVDTLQYSEKEMERIIRLGFDIARGRRKKLTSVDKANILDTSRLWREIATEVAMDYPDVELEHILVDACAMHLIRRPADFDVIVTENLFGDILTDEASMLAGSMGMLPSASLGKRRADGTGPGMYEPIHGSAPDIAGQGIASPVAMILSAAMMLRLSLGLEDEAVAIENAVAKILRAGHRPADIALKGKRPVKTARLGTLIAKAI